VCWRKGAEELRGRIKANPPVLCEGFVLVGWLYRGNGWYGFCDANPPYKKEILNKSSQKDHAI